MNYDRPQLRRMLAAEYALGTLTGRARARFERLLRTDPAARQELSFWELRFASLLRRIVPIRPRREVWMHIEHRMRGEPSVATISAAPAANEGGDRIVQAAPSRLWQAWAGFASAVSIVLAILLWIRPAPLPQAPVVAAAAPVAYVAQVTMPNSTMQWTFSLTPAHRRMSASTQGEAPSMLNGHSAELWWLSAAGPVAIGVLPTQGGGTMPLPANIDSGAIKLAVSIEPLGGSPTGKPTGPVVASVVAVQVV